MAISWAEIKCRRDFYNWLRYSNDFEIKEIAKQIVSLVNRTPSISISDENTIVNIMCQINTNSEDEEIISLFEIYECVAMTFMKRFCNDV